jgi:putative cardiolipin synthase
MYFFSKSAFLLIILMITLGACGSSKTEFPEVSTPAPVNQAAMKSERQFRLFTPTYDFNPNDRFSAEAVLYRFPLSSGKSSEFATLKPGLELYAARMQLLNQAKTSVRIQALLFTADESGYEIATKLIELVKKGLRVKIIVDPVSNITLSEQKLYYQMRKAGISIEGYEFMYLNFIAGMKQRGSIGATISDLNNRYHEKYFLIDAENPAAAIGIIGGSNLANDYFRADIENPARMWTDTDIVVRGAVVADMLRLFEENVAEFVERKRKLGLSHLGHAWDIARARSQDSSTTRPTRLRQLVVDRLRAAASKPVNFEWHEADARVVQSRPRHQEDLIAPAYIDFIDSSLKTVDIANAYFIADADLIAAIGRAVRRGVKVRIITNSESSLDFTKASVVLVSAARAAYGAVMKANANAANGGTVEIYEWGGHTQLKNGEGQIHSKFAVFDQRAAIVGSFNFDPRGRNLNSENIIALENPDLVMPLSQEIERFVQPGFSTIVTASQAASYAVTDSRKASLLQRISSILTPYL